MNKVTIMTLKRILMAASLGLLLATPSFAETLNRIVAVVNDDAITTYQLAQRLETLPPDQRESARESMLERMVEELLLEQRAEEVGVGVTDEEIDAAISDIQVQNRLTLEQLEQALQGQGQTLASYRDTLRGEILRYKLLGREVQAKADVTTQEIRNYLEEHADEYRLPPRVRLGVVNVALPENVSDEGRRMLQAKAGKVLEKLDEDEPFENILEEVGKDPDVNGSDLGMFAEQELSPLFSEAIQDLPIGGLSGILEVPGGFALLKVLDRLPGSTRPLEEVRSEIEAIVREQKTQALFEEWQKELRKEATIDIRL